MNDFYVLVLSITFWHQNRASKYQAAFSIALSFAYLSWRCVLLALNSHPHFYFLSLKVIITTAYAIMSIHYVSFSFLCFFIFDNYALCLELVNSCAMTAHLNFTVEFRCADFCKSCFVSHFFIMVMCIFVVFFFVRFENFLDYC